MDSEEVHDEGTNTIKEKEIMYKRYFQVIQTNYYREKRLALRTICMGHLASFNSTEWYAYFFF